MYLLESKSLLPTRRELAARVFRQRTIAVVCFLLVVAGFVLSGQFRPKYQSEMKILVRKQRVDPVVTSGQVSNPELQQMAVTDEEINSQVELLRNEDLLRDVVLQAGLVPAGETNAITIAKAVRKLQTHLTVAPVTKTNLISARYQGSTPEQARRVLATLAQLFLVRQSESPDRDYQVSFFDQQVKSHRQALEAAQDRLAAFTHKTGVVSADLQRELTVRQLNDTKAEHLQTQAAIADAEAREKAIAIEMAHQPQRISTDSSLGDNPQLLNQLKSTLLNLQLQRQQLLAKYDEHYRLVQDVDRQIATAQQMLDAQNQAPVRLNASGINPTRLALEGDLSKARAELSGLRAKDTQLTASSAGLKTSAEDLTDKDISQDALLRDVKTEKDQYQLYVDKLEQARMTAALDKNGILNVAIVQQPAMPALRENPVPAVLAATLFTGGLLSLGAAFLFDLFDPTIRTGAELVDGLQLPVLGRFGREIYLEGGQQ